MIITIQDGDVRIHVCDNVEEFVKMFPEISPKLFENISPLYAVDINCGRAIFRYLADPHHYPHTTSGE